MAKEIDEVKEEKAPKSDPAREAFLKVIEDYKKRNPEKYEIKKAAFEAKLKKKLAFGLTEGVPDGSIIVVGE